MLKNLTVSLDKIKYYQINLYNFPKLQSITYKIGKDTDFHVAKLPLPSKIILSRIHGNFQFLEYNFRAHNQSLSDYHLLESCKMDYIPLVIYKLAIFIFDYDVEEHLEENEYYYFGDLKSL